MHCMNQDSSCIVLIIFVCLCLDAMNTQIHEATGSSPYELVFGQKPRSVLFPSKGKPGVVLEEDLEGDRLTLDTSNGEADKRDQLQESGAEQEGEKNSAECQEMKIGMEMRLRVMQRGREVRLRVMWKGREMRMRVMQRARKVRLRVMRKGREVRLRVMQKGRLRVMRKGREVRLRVMQKGREVRLSDAEGKGGEIESDAEQEIEKNSSEGKGDEDREDMSGAERTQSLATMEKHLKVS